MTITTSITKKETSLIEFTFLDDVILVTGTDGVNPTGNELIFKFQTLMM